MIPPFVDAGWLEQHLDEVVPADVRWYLDGRSGAAAYAAGHLPGAVFVDLDDVLAAPPSERQGRHPLPSPEAFATAIGALGIGDGDPVVAYDDAGGVIAARLVWMLRAIEHPAALLDGGLGVWRGPLEATSAQRTPASFTARPWPPGRLATIDEVAALAGHGACHGAGHGDGDRVLVDARDRTRFAGGPDPVDPRSGHIPGARSVPAREHLNPGGRLLPAANLRARFADAGVDATKDVISYCGSGVTACHNLLVLEHAGLPAGRLYPGSWSQWSRDPDRPIETAETGTPPRPASR